MKRCNKCGEIKLETEFYKNKGSKDGLLGACKTCCNEQVREWRENNPEKVKEYVKKWAKNNPGKNKNRCKKWRENNPEKVKEQRRRKYIKLRKILSYKINNAISGGVQRSLKGNKNGMHWENSTGYTLEELMAHLEAQFEDWMTWENWGKISKKKRTWNIDHIKPQSLFNFTSVDDKEFKECWALENLQPLEAMENIIKSNNYTKI